MKILAALFEDSLRASVNERGNVEFGYGDSEFSPLAILASDQIAYESEFRAWLNDVWLAENLRRLDELLALHANEKRFADLRNAIDVGNAVPMVGSGMSRASGLPVWADFLVRLAEFSDIDPAEVRQLMFEGRFEEVVDLHAGSMGRALFDERVEHEFRVEAPGDVGGPIRLLPALFPNLVLTTNLDDVLEHVYEDADHRFAAMLFGRDVERYRQLHASGRRTLLKLHGDCRSDTGRVLGVAEYEDAYADGSPCREALALIFRTQPLLWLGCSLTIDRTVRLAREVVEVDANGPRHYALLPLPDDDEDRKVRERALTELKIFPIWYDGDHDECIEAVIVGLLHRLGRLPGVDG